MTISADATSVVETLPPMMPPAGVCRACFMFEHGWRCEQPDTCVCCGSNRPELAALIALPDRKAARADDALFEENR